MTTLGKQISDLLQRNGIPGPILSLSAGPSLLSVTYYRLDDAGRKFFDEDGHIAVATVELDLRAEAAE